MRHLRRYVLPLVIAMAGVLLFAFYRHAIQLLPERIAESDQTMLMADSMRHTFKVGMLSQRAFETYLLGLRNRDPDAIMDAVSLMEASLGFVYSGYIENQQLIERAVPLIEQSMYSIKHNGLDISPEDLRRLSDNLAAIRREVASLEKSIWVQFQRDFIAFQSGEFELQIVYQVAAIGASFLMLVIAVLFLHQKGLNRAIVRKQQDLQRSEERFSLAMQAAQDGLWDYDVASGETYYSPGWQRILGEDRMAGTYVTWAKRIHPEDRPRVLKTLQQHMQGETEHWHEEHRLKRKDGAWVWVLGRGKVVVRDHLGKPQRMIGTMTDISSRKHAEERISYQATHDILTGLFNRHEFERRTRQLVTDLQSGDEPHALCFIDLDQFKVVNDTCGHIAGDELLCQISKVLINTVRKNDTLARLGGDEFGILMAQCSLEQAKKVAASLLERVHDIQFHWEGQTFRISASIGLVAVASDAPSFTELLKQADAACYMAKDLGRNRTHVYHPEDMKLAQRQGEMRWVARITQALEDDRFCLYGQPIVPLDNSDDRHYELLVRMIDKEGRVILPGAFLPAAERYNQMKAIDVWVIKRVFVLLATNPTFLAKTSFISVNLSAQSLTSRDILSLISSQLESSGIAPDKLCFEITETAAISNLSAAQEFISTLKQTGCRFALDDFGSGLSSFGYLKNIPADYLKIDGVFVKDIVEDSVDHAMVRSIHEIGRVMNMRTIAEFVENDEIRSALQGIGVDYAQGYGIGEPVPIKAILESSLTVQASAWPSG